MNKNIWIFAITCLLIPILSSCEDDAAQAGSSSLATGEDVIVCSDTLRDIYSGNVLAEPAYITPDSFLLGECRTQDYGTIVADILTQFSAPEGWVYPETAELDSVCLYIYYDSWFGDGNAPMGITAYELDREPLNYDSLYASNTDISRFCSKQPEKMVLTENQIFSASLPTDSIYSSTIYSYINFLRCKLNNTYAQKLFNIRDFSSQEAFNKQFQGLMITPTYGSSCALYVSTICLNIHYHYSYTEGGQTKTMSDCKVLYSNNEVKQFSHYLHKDREQVFEKLSQDTLVNYIISPSNTYCMLTIPTADILNRIDTKTKSRAGKYINMARLRLDVLNGDAKGSKEESWMKPAKNMLLIGEDEYDNVFKKGKLPADTTAVYGTLTSEYDSTTTEYNYYYSFDLSTPFTNLVHNKLQTDTLRLILVPVDLGYTTSSSSTYVSRIRMKQCITTTVIKSSRNPITPMDIEIVYSGFSTSLIKK